jgi:hypothetical protein
LPSLSRIRVPIKKSLGGKHPGIAPVFFIPDRGIAPGAAPLNRAGVEPDIQAGLLTPGSS